MAQLTELRSEAAALRSSLVAVQTNLAEQLKQIGSGELRAVAPVLCCSTSHRQVAWWWRWC